MFYLTKAGLDSLGSAWEKLLPDVIDLSSKWQSEDLAQLRSLLERLKNQLDEARD